MENEIVINGLTDKVEYKLYDEISFCGYLWYIIKVEKNRLTLLMKDVLDRDSMTEIFDREYLDNDCDVKYSNKNGFDWQKSIIKKGLNDKFLDKLDIARLLRMNTNYDENKSSKDYVRLLTIREAEKLPENIRKSSKSYWTMSTSSINVNWSYTNNWGYMNEWLVESDGSLNGWHSVVYHSSVRPVIQIKVNL